MAPIQGKIIKGIAGFYYVHVAESGIYECKAKGIFRNRNVKPLVGDNVEMEVLDEKEKTGSIGGILPRSNALIRPAVANIDLAVVIFAAAQPEPAPNLLDRFLVTMGHQEIPVTICFNKADLVAEERLRAFADIYRGCGYPVICASAKEGSGVEALLGAIAGKTAAVAGPSGVGKSSLINRLQSGVRMETGEISRKTRRGRHTTRHTELIPVCEDTYIMDTPGFSTLDIPGLEKERLSALYPEFAACGQQCRFRGCSHISEPGCGVKEALKAGEISGLRYENYKLLYEEMKNSRKY